MIDIQTIQAAFSAISRRMTENRSYLIELDAQNGDGDLGISMDTGFKAVAAYLQNAEEADLGRLFLKASKVFNEASPSSLGTILSFALMGIAKSLKGKGSAQVDELVDAMDAGVRLVMEKAGSKPGEKTILDALCPALEALKASAGEEVKARFDKAAQAAAQGSESTRRMRSVHGRAAYYGDKSIGLLDGGSVVGKLIFEAIAQSL
ncbi:MAG: dihydroxyacetone kinase subunit L [Candidatus Limiplasma sp.]|nr:dihydroxyacetone kinase subunit L [Candidatus Limiplasma sp.]